MKNPPTFPVWLLSLSLGVAAASARPALAFDMGALAKKAASSAGGAAHDEVFKKVNAKLLAEGRKDQCSFKSDSDELMPGCDAKVKKLASTLVDVKKQLVAAGVRSYKFEVSGHTDSSGKPEHNKELSAKRAAVIARELVAKGIPRGEIISVGMGAERPLVTPDDTEAKRKKNRRYEIQVR
jgi:outer membrane protein OmpA-like peptidoglycan-associated protein